MRSFKPALARDYDVFFAAIGLLCGGILFFQGWRLDPILQFGQFLLAGTTVFFAYESVRLRGVATDQARRSSYFDDPEPGISPDGGLRGGRWQESYDRFEEPQSISRRFSSRDDLEEDTPDRDLYQPRRISRAAIPEEAASRMGSTNSQEEDFDQTTERQRRMGRFRNNDSLSDKRSNFGERRNSRQDLRMGSRPSANEQISPRRRGGRPSANEQLSPRRGGRPLGNEQIPPRRGGRSLGNEQMPSRRFSGSGGREISSSSPKMDSPIRRTSSQSPSSAGSKIEDASFSNKRSNQARNNDIPRRNRSSEMNPKPSSGGSTYSRSSTPNKRPRDNTSRFDD